jgi:hypothetical protein
MKTVICPKCKQPVFVPRGVDYVICCNEVIFVINDIDLANEKTMKIAFNSIKHLINEDVSYNSKNEKHTEISRRKQKRNFFKWLRFH